MEGTVGSAIQIYQLGLYFLLVLLLMKQVCLLVILHSTYSYMFLVLEYMNQRQVLLGNSLLFQGAQSLVLRCISVAGSCIVLAVAKMATMANIAIGMEPLGLRLLVFLDTRLQFVQATLLIFSSVLILEGQLGSLTMEEKPLFPLGAEIVWLPIFHG